MNARKNGLALAELSDILIVDNAKQNLDAAFLLPNYLPNLNPTLCDDPVRAWQKLAANPTKFGLIVTDNDMTESQDGIAIFKLATGYGIPTIMLLGPTLHRPTTDALMPCFPARNWFAGKRHVHLWYEALTHFTSRPQNAYEGLARQDFFVMLAQAHRAAEKTEFCPGLATKRGQKYTTFLHLPEHV